MDTSVAVNSLRAQFLKVCPERDQVRRIVKPYDLGNHNNYNIDKLDDRIRDMYRDKDGNYMLPELESPPIMTNFLEDYITTRKIRNAKANNKNNINNNDNDTDDINGPETLTKKSQLIDDPSILRGDSILFNPQDMNRNTSETNKNNVQGELNRRNQQQNHVGIPQFASVTYDSDDSDSESQTKHKRSALPFTRIFKGSNNRRDESNKTGISSHGNTTNNNGKLGGPGNTVNCIAQRTLKKHSKYSMNFDYDDILDEDLEDEGEDEEDVNDNQLKSQFFQLDRSSSRLHDINNDNPTNNNNSGNNNSGNVLHTGTPNGNDKLKVNSKTFSLDTKSLLENAFASPNDSDKNQGNTDASLLNTSNGSQQGNDTNETITTSGNIINVSRLKSHLPQLPLLDSSRNANGTSSKSISSVTHDNSDSNRDTRSDSKIGDSDLSDIESFIKEDDLKSINLEHHDSNNNTKSMTLTPMTSKHIDEYTHSMSVIHNQDSSDEEDDEHHRHGDDSRGQNNDPTGHDLSEESSFGKSLLESDYASTEYLKNNDRGSIATDNLSLDTDIVRHTVSSHSIPISFEGYGLYQGANDSTLNNVLDRAVTKIKSNAPHAGRERANSSASRRNSITQTLNSKRTSLTSNPMVKHTSLRHHLRSSSNNATESSKYSSLYGSSIQRNKPTMMAKTDPTNKMPIPSRSSSRTSRRNSKDLSLHFEKLVDPPVAKTSNSKLSSLFNKKKHKVTNPVDVLEYFSFVSGNTVPRFDAMDLEVYIQASKKYKRNSFKTKVRKTAKIFDVIGYILYLYTSEFKPDNIEDDGFDTHTLIDPNNFALHIVDEDGEPFEDNFGKLNRTSIMQSISDNEIVLCEVGSDEKMKNEAETPVPYDVNGDVVEYAKSISSKTSIATNNNSSFNNNNEETTINQISFYKPMVGGNIDELANNSNNSNVLEVTVYKYPNVNPKFNFTTVNVLVTGNINDILVKYCRMKNMDPNEYALKMIGKNRIFDLNDTVLRLDGNNKVEIITKKEARRLQLEKIKPNLTKPQLPTIQSNDLTPMTLEPAPAFLTNEDINDGAAPATEVPVPFNKLRKTSGKIKLNLSKQNSSGNSNVNNTGSFFKNKDSSRHSLHTPIQMYHNNHSGILNEYTPDNTNGSNNFQDLFSGAYHKYKVWRRQQMSLITKHERTLALDGDYVYIVPPEGKMHWHENVKTKSFHISQVVLVKKSKRVAEYFKIYVRRGPEDIKRYYFEAVSAQECTEIVSRITNLLNAYKMNHK